MPKKRRSAAQRAATKRLIAHNRRSRRNPRGLGGGSITPEMIKARYFRMKSAGARKKGPKHLRKTARRRLRDFQKSYKKKLYRAKRGRKTSLARRLSPKQRRQKAARKGARTRKRRRMARSTVRAKRNPSRRTRRHKRSTKMARTKRRRRHRRNPAVMANPRRRRRRARRGSSRRRRNPHYMAGTGRWGSLQNPRRKRRRSRRRGRRNPSHKRRRAVGVRRLRGARRAIRGKRKTRAARRYIRRYHMRSNPGVGGVLGVLKSAVPVVLAMAAGTFIGTQLASRLPVLSSLGKNADPVLSIGLVVAGAMLTNKVAALRKYRGAILTGLGINAVRSVLKAFVPSVAARLGMGEYVATSGYSYDVGEYVATSGYIDTGAEEDLAGMQELGDDAQVGGSHMLAPIPFRASVRQVPAWDPAFSEDNLYQGVFAGGF